MHVNVYFPLATLIEPLPSAVIVKSPAIASAELEELVDVDELEELDVLDELELDEVTDWPDVPGLPGLGSVTGWRRSIVSRMPSEHAILTVEPTK